MSWRIKVSHDEYESSYKVILSFNKNKYQIGKSFCYYNRSDLQKIAWEEAIKLGNHFERDLTEIIIEDDN